MSQNVEEPQKKSVRWRANLWFVVFAVAPAVVGPLNSSYNELATKFLVRLFEVWTGDLKSPAPERYAKSRTHPGEFAAARPISPASRDELAKCKRDRSAALRQTTKKIESAGSELDSCRAQYRKTHPLFGNETEMSMLCDGWTRNISALQNEAKNIETWCDDIAQ